MSKYKNSLYPDKINDLIDNDGNVNAEKVEASGIAVLKVAPTADNTDGDIKFVQLDEEPAERFNGYYYLIGNSEPKPNPKKGDIICVNLGETLGKQCFRVLNINNGVAELLAMQGIGAKFNSSSVTAEFADGTTGQKYAEGTLDALLNTTWYGQLSDAVKAAIVEKNLTQDMWWTSGTHEGETYIMNYVSAGSEKNENITKKVGATLTIGNRKIYAISIQDILNFYNKEVGDTLTSDELMGLIGTDIQSNEYNWLSSASADRSDGACYVNGGTGYVRNSNCGDDYRVRPALSLKLSEVEWY